MSSVYNEDLCRACDNHKMCPVVRYYIDIVKEKDEQLNELFENIMAMEREITVLKQERR